MPLSLYVTPQFKKDLSKIPLSIKIETDRFTQQLRQNPLDKTLNIRKLKLPKIDLWRLRIGKYRLIYSFNKSSLILHRIQHRKDVYRKL